MFETRLLGRLFIIIVICVELLNKFLREILVVRMRTGMVVGTLANVDIFSLAEGRA